MTVRQLIHKLIEIPMDEPVRMSIKKGKDNNEVIYVGSGKIKVTAPKNIGDRGVWIEDRIIDIEEQLAVPNEGMDKEP